VAILAVGTLIVLAGLELLFVFYYRIADGNWRSPARKIEAEINKAQDPRDPRIKYLGPGCSWSDMFRSHPFLGYVKHPAPPCADRGVNNRGFRGPDYPLEKQPGTFTLMVTGGSVAEEQMGFDPGITELEKDLNAHYSVDGITHFKVLVGAMAAWRQPEQFIVFSLYNQLIDGVLTIDGYNEHFIFLPPIGSQLETPPDPFRFRSIDDVVDVKKASYATLDGALFRWQIESPILAHSRLLYFVVSHLRARFRSLAVQAADRPNGSVRMWGLPSAPPWSEEKRFGYNLDRYRRYIEMMNFIARGYHIRTLHLIQPVPAIDKQLTPEELEVVGNLGYRDLYQRMVDRLLDLRKQGIPIYSVLDLFKTEKRTVYIDPVHYNGDGRGLMETRILHELEEHWGFKRVR
jgi:hypothetical protein